MNIAKKFMVVSIAVGMMLLFGGYAAAGPDVVITITNSNEATIENSIENAASTGTNVIAADEDVEGGTIETGDADATVDVQNDVNSNEAEVDLDNDTEGEVDVTQDNDADIFNGVGNLADTGFNVIASDDADVEDGEITTGDADAAVTIENAGSAINSNSTTIDASGADDLELTVDHDNGLGIDNEVENMGLTGDNVIAADEDVEGGTIDTGNASADVEITNDGNSNETDLDVSGSDDLEGTVEQDNSGGVFNGIGNLADTGFNTLGADDEVEGGEITTGDASSSENVVTRLNRNIVRFR